MGYSSFDRTMQGLFGKPHHAELFILMPYLASCVNELVDPASGICAESITRRHTAFSYCVLADLSWYDPDDIREGMWNGTLKNHSGFRTVKKDTLCYCPACACDDRKKYGETYWHRIHQIRGITVCEKHGTVIKSSGISFKQTRHGFYPASAVTNMQEKAIVSSEKEWKRIEQLSADIAWVMDNGQTIRKKRSVSKMMKQYLSVKGFELTGNGCLNNSEIGLKGFGDFHLEHKRGFFSHPAFQNIFQRQYVPLWTFDFFEPLDIIMLAEYLEGTAEDFFELTL